MALEKSRQYFKEEKERLEDLHHLMLDFHYIGGSLKIIEDLFCRPGFGINNVQHSTCFNCCVVCSPGEYSSTYEPYCKKCAHMGKEEYGAAYC
uniref:Zona-pellucida-binding protein 1/2 C-terminal domain-containing protein n=1 Tax=Eptatretus burgeri TaxID=7764 RepID=A0A8C4QXE6_EPTBU